MLTIKTTNTYIQRKTTTIKNEKKEETQQFEFLKKIWGRGSFGQSQGTSMIIQYKNIAIHCKINDIRIVWILIHCENNTTHYKINDILIARILIHWKNNAVHYKINNICIAWMLIHCKKHAIHLMIYVLPGC